MRYPVESFTLPCSRILLILFTLVVLGDITINVAQEIVPMAQASEESEKQALLASRPDLAAMSRTQQDARRPIITVPRHDRPVPRQPRIQ